MIKMIKGFFVLLFVTTSLLYLTAIATADTIYVDDDSTCLDECGTEQEPYPTIQGAIDDSSSGDTIEVAAGTYNEQLNISHSLTIHGAGADDTIIDSGGPAPVVYAIGASEVTLEALTVTGGIGGSSWLWGGGIYTQASSFTLLSAVVRDNSANYGGGITTGGGW